MFLKKSCAALVTAWVLTSCGSHISRSSPGGLSNTLSQQEKKGGWQLLFDGSSYKGWHTYGGSAVGSAWIIKDSSLYLDAAAAKSGHGGDIVTDAVFSDFHLKYDWKIAPGGNSGLIFYVQEDTSRYRYPWQTGPEMQVLDNELHADAKFPKHRAGDLYDLLSASSEPVNPALQWNHAEIISRKGQLDFYLNGRHVLSTPLWDSAWKKMIVHSKFSSMPGFGMYRSGKISLQDHGDGVWFRNVKIKVY